MANYDALQALAQEAYNRGSPYLTVTEGWVRYGSMGGLTINIIPQQPEPITKINVSLNKPPKFAVKYFVDHLQRVRQQFDETSVDTEYIEYYPDGSFLAKECNTFANYGPIDRYVYFSTREDETGTITGISAPVDLPQYPASRATIDFIIMKAVPTATGTDLTVIFKKDVKIELDNQSKQLAGLLSLQYYAAFIQELESAPLS